MHSRSRIGRTALALAMGALLFLAACQSTAAIDSPQNAALGSRMDAVSAAIDAEVAAQQGTPYDFARSRRLEQCADASRRLGAVRMLTYGSSLVPDVAQRRCAVRELSRLESELGISR